MTASLNEIELTPSQHWFLRYGDECYATARFCYFAFAQALVFRMAHHTLEYYLKAILGRDESLDQLRTFSHRLNRLAASVEERRGVRLQSRPILDYMDTFERLRYPRMDTFTHVLWGCPYEEFFARFPPELRRRCACFFLSDFDRVVAELRELAVPPEWPLWAGPGQLASEFLHRDNACFRAAEANTMICEPEAGQTEDA